MKFGLLAGLAALSTILFIGCHKCTTYYTDNTVYPSVKQVPRTVVLYQETSKLTKLEKTRNKAVYHQEVVGITDFKIPTIRSEEPCIKVITMDAMDRVFYTDFTCIENGETLKVKPGKTYSETTYAQRDLEFRRIKVEKGEYETKGLASASASSSSGLFSCGASANVYVNIESVQKVLFSVVGFPEKLYTIETDILVAPEEEFWLGSNGGIYNKLPLIIEGEVMRELSLHNIPSCPGYFEILSEYASNSVDLEDLSHLADLKDRSKEGRVGSFKLVSSRERTKD
jgi:hypothetical protein